MEREMIKLRDLTANPFKAKICQGKLDPKQVARLKESIQQSWFWDGIVARRVGPQVQVAFGHHRVQAAKEIFGEEHAVMIQVESLTDLQMLQLLASENAGKEGIDNWRARRDMALLTREWLKMLGHEGHCDIARGEAYLARQRARGAKAENEEMWLAQCKRGIHGSPLCIAMFLGEENWGVSEVKELIVAAGLDPNLADQVQAQPTGIAAVGKPQGVITPEAISQTAAVALSSLTGEAQKVLVEGVRESKLVVSDQEAKELMAKTKVVADEISQEEQKKVITDHLGSLGFEKKDVPQIIDSLVKESISSEERNAVTKKLGEGLRAIGVKGQVSKQAQSLAAEMRDAALQARKNAQAVAVKQVVDQFKKDQEMKKFRPMDQEARDISKNLYQEGLWATWRKLETIAGNKEHLSPGLLEDLIANLRNTIKQRTEFLAKLEAPATPKLNEKNVQETKYVV